ncbi:MAG: Ig-like domain-containing protein, partial [Verrucomicrobiota bacterium]
MNNAQRNCRPAPHVNTGGLWLWLLVFGLFLPTGGWAQTIMNFNSGSATQIRLTAGASTNIGIQVSITATNPPAANQLIITKDGAEWATNDMLYAPNLSVPPAGDVPGTAVFTTTINLSAAGAYQFSCPGAVRALTIAVNRPPVITSFRVNGIGADPILVLGPSLNFTFAVNDPDGIADIRSVELVINGIVTAIPLPYTSFIINPMPSGSLSAQLRVKDALATSYVYSPLLNLNIKDNEPPTVDINTPVFASSPVTLVAPPALLFDTLALPPIADIPWGDTVKSVELLLKVGKGNFNPIETGVYLPAVPNPEGSVIRFAGLWDMPPTLLTPDGTTLHSFGLVARDSRDAVSATNTIPFYVIPNAAPTVILTNLVPGAQYAVAPDGSTLTVAGHALDESGITNITFAVTGDGIIGAAAGTARFVPTTNNWFVAQNVDIPWSFPITTRGPDNHATDMTILVTATDLHGLAKTATNTIRILRALNVREVLPLAGGDFTQINASGSGGDAAGYSTTTDGTPRAIRWNNKQGTVRLDYNSDGLGSQATAINSSGNTVGYSKNVAGRLAATVWSANGNVDTLISLNDVLDITATGIADNNQIVGYSGNIGVVWDGIKGNPASLGDFIPFCISEDGALAGGYTLFHPSDPTETGTNAAVMRLSDNAVFWVNNAAALANGIVQSIHKQSGGTYGIAGVCNNDNSPTRGWYATCDATTLTATDMTFIGTATQESRVYSYNGNYYASLYTNGFDNAYIGTTSVETMRLTPTGWRFLWAVGASAAGETAGNGVYQQARRGWVITGPVIGNALPEGNVTLADSDASTQSSPATFHINFEGQDPDGINKKIPKVCLVANNAIIATYLNQTQFTFTWTAPNVGTYQIDALLDDNSGQILRVSGPLVTVAPNPNQMLYRLIPIATDEFNAYRINNNGDVVGSLGNEAVLWHGGMWQLGNFGADSAEILAINNSGQLLINTYRDITMFNTVTRAWLANENLELKEVTRDPGDSITATALNDSGLVAGNLIDSALVNRPFLWDGNNVTFLGNGVAGTITPTQIGPDASQITASLTLANGKSQVGLLSPNNFTPFPTLGGLQNEVNDYTPGYAVGGAQTGSALRPVVWSGAGTTWNLLQPAMPAEAVAGTLNGIVAGTPPVVAGTLDGPNGEWVPVIGTPTALQSLNVLLAPADKTTWTLDSVIGINPAGQVLATAYDTAENPYVVLLVPEDVYRTNTPPRITSAYSLLPRATNTVPFDLQLNDTAPGRVTIAQMLVWSGTTNTVVLEKHWLRASSAVEWNTFWSPEQAGTYKIFFRVTDNLGKTTIYPNGADINENLATQVTVTLALTETEMVVERIGVPSNAEWNQPHLVSQTTSPTLPILPTPLTITNLMGLGLDENGHTFGVLKFQGSLRFSALGATYYGTNWTPWVSSNNTVYIIAPPLLGVGSGYYEPIIECTPLAMSGNSQVYGNIKLGTGIGASKTTNTFSFQAPINTRGPTIIHGPIAAYTGDPNVGNYRKLKAVNRDDFVIGDGNYKTNNIMTQFNYLCLDDQFQFLPTPNPPLAKGTLPTAYVSSLNNLDDIGGLLLFYINNTIPNNYFFPMYWTRSGPNQLGAHTATLLPKPANILFKDTDQQGLTYLNDLRRAVHEGYHTNGTTLEYYAYQRNLNDPACAADLLVYQPLTNTISRPIMAGWNNRSQALLALRDGTAVKNYFVIGGRRLLVNDLIAGKTALPLLLDVATAINQNGQIVVNGRPNAVNSVNGQSYLISPKYMLVANSATTDVLQNTDFSVNIDFINKDTESKTLQLVLTLPVGVTIGTVPPNAVRQNNPADGTTTLTLAQLVGKPATSTTLTTLTLTSVLAPPANIAITNYTATLSDGVIISGTPRVWKTTAVPVVTIDSPTDGASFAASSPIPISATANSYNGAITSLEMMLDETNLLTTAATLTPQAQIGWTNSIPGLTTGLHTLHAKATDTRNIQGGKTITLNITKPITPGAPNGYLKAFYEQALVFDQQSVTNPVRIGITVTATANPLHSIAILINGMVYRTLAGLTANTYVFSVPWLNPTPGDYQLTAQITDTAGSSFTTDPLTIHVYRTPPAPPNDMLANATDLAASMKGRFNQWTNLNNYGATWQAGEPQHAKKDSASSVWYAWPCTNSGRTLIKAIPTPSATPLDTILAVYTPTLPTAPLSFTNLTLIDANDDSGASIGSAITFNASANKTYYIMVSGYGDAQGKFTLLISQTELPIVSIINPKDGDNLRAGDTVTVTIQTSDPDGAISAVELYDNGTLISGIGNGSVGGISEIPNSETISEIGLTATASSWAGWNLISQGWRPGPKINDQGDIVFNRVGAANVGATLYTFNGMISIGAHKPVIVPALADIALKWKGVIPPNNPAQIDPNNTQLGSGQPVSFQTLLPELLPTQKPPVTTYGSQFANNPIALSCGTGVTNLISREAYYMQRFLAPADNPTMSFFLRANEAAQLEFDGSILLSFPRHTAFVGDPNADAELMRAQYSWNSRSGVQTLATHAFYDNYIFLPVPCNDTLAGLNNFTLIANSARDTLAKYYNGQSKAITVNGIPPGWHTIVIRYGAGEPRDLNRMANPGDPLYIFPDGFGGLASNPNYNKALNDMMAFYSTDNIHWRSIDTLPPLQTAHSGIAGIDNTGRSAVNYRSANVFTTDDIYTTAFIGRPNNDLAPVPTPSTFSRYTYWT